MLSIEKMTRFHIDKIKTPFEIGQSYKDVFINGNSPSYAGVVNNEVVAVGGASVVDGVGEAWYMVSQEGLLRPYDSKICRNNVRSHTRGFSFTDCKQALGQDRLQTDLSNGGFEEGCYGATWPNKADYIRYAVGVMVDPLTMAAAATATSGVWSSQVAKGQQSQQQQLANIMLNLQNEKRIIKNSNCAEWVNLRNNQKDW